MSRALQECYNVEQDKVNQEFYSRHGSDERLHCRYEGQYVLHYNRAAAR